MASCLDNIARFFSLSGATVKSAGKILLLSRRSTVSRAPRNGQPLIVMGNGPSLGDVIAHQKNILTAFDTMAVNFAANAPEYESLQPNYYILADPHFKNGKNSDDPNVRRLFERLDALTEREMTLLIPARWKVASLGLTNPLIRIERFNPVGIESWKPLCRLAFDAGLATPSPRNVLIPAIMTGIWLGYKTIYITGADHSWLKTLSVSEDNEVVTLQPHFYKDNAREQARVSSVYRDVRLHDILLSFHLAFKSYHHIADYARSRGVEIINSTPGSFIDAFPRKPLPSPQT